MTNKLMLAAMLALLSSAPALAQDTPAAFDSRWNPYLGCWTIVQDQRGRSAPVPAGTMVCVRPSGRFGVAITTTVDGKNVLEQTIVADGSAQPLSQGDCSGTQTSNWSRDGERLFTAVELECANRPKRTVSGITLLANGQWVDAQATVIDGNADVRLRRYRRTSDHIRGPAGMTTAPLSDRGRHRGERESAVGSARGGARRSERAIRAEQPRAHAACRQRRVAERHRPAGRASLSGEVRGAAQRLSVGVDRVVVWNRVDGQLVGLHGLDDVSVADVRPVLQQLLLLLAVCVSVLLGPELQLSLRLWLALLSQLLQLQHYYGLGGGGYYGGASASGRPGGGNAQPGDRRLARRRRGRRQRPRLHESEAGRIEQTSSGTGESATPYEPHDQLRRAACAARAAAIRVPAPSSSSLRVSSSGSSSSGASSGGYSSGGGGDSGGGGRTAQPR